MRFASPAVLTGGQHNIQPGEVYDWVLAKVPDDADAVFFGGNGFRVVGVIERLERDLQRPVLSANQVLFWAALHAAGVTDMPVAGYGRLLAENPMCETFGQSPGRWRRLLCSCRASACRREHPRSRPERR